MLKALSSWKRIMRIAQIIFKRGNEVLLGYRQNVQAENELWGFPSGKIELGETPLEAAIREAKEEVGVIVQGLNELFVLIDHNGKEHHFFLCTEWSGKLVNAEPELCREISWFPLSELPSGSTNITFSAKAELNKSKQFMPLKSR